MGLHIFVNINFDITYNIHSNMCSKAGVFGASGGYTNC